MFSTGESLICVYSLISSRIIINVHYFSIMLSGIRASSTRSNNGRILSSAVLFRARIFIPGRCVRDNDNVHPEITREFHARDGEPRVAPFTGRGVAYSAFPSF